MAMSAPMSAPADPPPPSRLRRLVRSALWRSAARGLAAVLVVSAIVAPLAALGWTTLAIFAAVTVGLNVGLWAGRDSGLASLAGAVLIPIVGLIIVLGSDVQVIGPRSGTIALDDIAHFPYAGRFRFTDARVATEFTTATEQRSGLIWRVGWRVAPIVPGNWRPYEPVRAWAVARTSGYGPLDFRTPRSWEQSYRAAVRYVPTAFSPAHAAVERALARFDLTAAPGAPLLYWVEDPHAVVVDERNFLAWVMFGGVATWLFFLIGEALLVPIAPDARPGPPQPGKPQGGIEPLSLPAKGGAA
jgi:hypothetical protein